MLTCTSPILLSGAFPCGKCAACLSQRRRTWAHRIIMESYGHVGKSTFVTLTYAEEKVPRGRGDVPTLEISHVRNFIKRIRKNIGPVRYFAVGEYGERSWRPHYHVALFGLPRCAGGPVVRQGKAITCVCLTCSNVRTTWGFGHTMVAELSAKSAMYIAGYVVKKMTSSMDPRLDGRAPEFARMSLRPGIGALALAPVVSALEEFRLPVPHGLRHGDRILPFGRYIRRQIAKQISDGSPEGIQNALNSGPALEQSLEAVRVLRAYAWDNEIRPLDVLKQITPQIQSPSKKETL